MRTWIEKQKYLIDYTLSSMARRRGKNLGLLLLYTLLVFLLASVMLFTGALRQEARRALAHAPDVIVQRMVAGRHDLVPAAYLETIAQIRGVQNCEGRLYGYYYDPVLKANFTLMTPPAAMAHLVGPGRVTVGPGLSRELAVRLNAPLVLQSYTGEVFSYAVAGVLPPETELVTADLILMSEADFRTFFHYPAGHYTDIGLSVANPQERHTVAGKVSTRLPDTRTLLRDDALRTYESVFTWREGIVLLVLSGAVLAFAILAMERASGLSADERREIGILKAVGWETGDVLRMKFFEGALLSLTAFLAGYCAAWLHVFHFSTSLFEPVLRGWSTLFPRLELTPVVDGFQVATLFFFTVLPYAAATLAPIWRAAITDPDSVMRG